MSLRASAGQMDNSNYLAPNYTSRSFTAFDQQYSTRTASRSVGGHDSFSAQKTQSRSEWYPMTSGGTPDVINRIELKNSASSVVLAFRELQEKAKQIEFERIAAASEVEDLKRRLSEARRNESLQRSRSEIRTTDEVLLIREHCERLLEETGQLQTRVSRASEVADNEHRDIAYHRTRCTELNEETSRNHVAIQSLEYRLSQLQEDVYMSNGRAEEIEQKLLSFKSTHTTQITNEHRVAQLRTKINRESAASLRTNSRITALQKYMEIILQVNGDLTEALKNKEISSSRIFRIVESHTKHMASRDSVHCQSTNDLRTVPNSPAKRRSLSTDDLLKTTTLKKKAKKVMKSGKKGSTAKKSVLDMDDEELEQLSTDRGRATKRSRVVAKKATKRASADAGTKKKKKDAASTSKAAAKKKKIASVLDMLDQEDSRDPREETSRLYTDENYEASLLSRIAALRKEKAQYAEAASRLEARERDVEVGTHRGSALRSSSDSRVSSASQRSSRSPSRISVAQDSSRSSWLLKPTLNPRYHDREMFDATGGTNSEDRKSPLARSASADPARGRRGDVNSGGRARTRSLSSQSRHRDRESGLIQTAGRLAATAAATAAAAAANAQSSGRVGRIFVPSSPCQSKEFNVMASVSKAARSAREMNATLASRVKSLDFDGCGPQFSEITKIDLSDMHDYLTVVKKLRESGTIQ